MPHGKYERELKKILMGDEEQIEDSTKSCSDEVKEKYLLFKDTPLLVNRGAGSFGVDLMAVRNDMNFIIEVKSCKNDVIYLSDSGRLKEQRSTIQEYSKNYGITPLYAYRIKTKRGERWEFFTALDSFDYPSFSRTTQGGFKLDWGEGMKLSEFAEKINDKG